MRVACSSRNTRTEKFDENKARGGSGVGCAASAERKSICVCVCEPAFAAAAIHTHAQNKLIKVVRRLRSFCIFFAMVVAASASAGTAQLTQ